MAWRVSASRSADLDFWQPLQPKLGWRVSASGLRTLTLSWDIDQRLVGWRVFVPAGLQTLTIGNSFNQSLDGVSLPAGLQTLTFGNPFNQSLDGVSLPAGLQTLTFGKRLNQSLDGVSLPAVCGP